MIPTVAVKHTPEDRFQGDKTKYLSLQANNPGILPTTLDRLKEFCIILHF